MRKKILLVEDEAVTALGLESSLLAWGYEVMGPCGDGEEALRIAAQERPDAALMDLRLAGSRNGISVAVELRERFEVPTVFLTGQNTETTRSAAESARPVAFLIKPVADEKLRRAIEAALSEATSFRSPTR